MLPYQYYYCIIQLVFVITKLIPVYETFMQCSRVHKSDPSYYLIGHCLKSELTVIANGYQHDLTSCMQYAIESRGLALNFRQVNGGNRKMSSKLVTYDTVKYDENDQSTCQVLDCPETENFTSLETSSVGFDYYSFYADPLPILNFTCVPSVGLFHIHKKPRNYTEAIEICQEESGDLAHILTETRTNGIATLIKQVYQGPGLTRKLFYVGLQDVNGNGRFETPLGEPLDCFPYRAWAPANPKPPKKKHQCVVIDTNKMWRAVSCSRKLPFICELYPNGPLNMENVTLPDTDC